MYRSIVVIITISTICGLGLGAGLPDGPISNTKKVYEQLEALYKGISSRGSLTVADIKAADEESQLGWEVDLNNELEENRPDLFFAGQMSYLINQMAKYTDLSENDQVRKLEQLYKFLRPLVDTHQIGDAQPDSSKIPAMTSLLLSVMNVDGTIQFSRTLIEEAMKEYVGLLNLFKEKPLREENRKSMARIYDILDHFSVATLERHIFAHFKQTRDVRSLKVKCARELTDAGYRRVEDGVEFQP